MNIDKKKVSYVLGQSIGGDFRRQGFDIDIDVFVKSFTDALSGMEPSMSVGEMQLVFQQFQQDIQEKNQIRKQQLAGVNLEKGAAFLAENRKTPGVVETRSGLQYKVVVEGNGERPKATDTVETHYEGRTLDGKVFDSSYRRGTTTSFPLNAVIKGWTEALQLMTVGSKWELYIPSDLAYGLQGSGGTIEPNSTLVFTVELIGIK
jgi:FKBP-type peptidyl-prolyl cis-trans isomerase FklB